MSIDSSTLCGRTAYLETKPSSVFATVDSIGLGSDRGRYESDPIFDVLLQITVERNVWPLPYVPSDGRKLALAFLAAKE